MSASAVFAPDPATATVAAPTPTRTRAEFPSVTPATVRGWLNHTPPDGGEELAFLDVREAGQFGEGHPFFAVPLAYSRIELDAPRLLPRPGVRIALLDGGDGVSAKAAARLSALGYTDIHILDGGAPAWAAAGYTLFQGVNLPSKTFGERVEAVLHTPHISAQELHRRQAAGEPLLLLDGRTPEEHRKVTIPGALSVPNGELAARWQALAPDPTTPIVVHCAGRTRSIVGAQILRSLGVPNPVLALENGTQGWALAGFALERGSTRSAEAAPIDPAVKARAQASASAEAARHGAPVLSLAQAQQWLDDATRSTYLLDVRSAAEFAAGSLPGARHAPGGQLLQATDQSVAVRGARLLLLDDDAIRAPVVAAWLRRLGHEAATVEGGITAPLRAPASVAAVLPPLASITPGKLLAWAPVAQPLLIDLQPSLAYRRAHAAGALWAVRPRVAAVARAALQAQSLAQTHPVLLLAPDEATAQLAAIDLREAGIGSLHWARADDWARAGLPLEASPDSPADADAIDYLFFVHDRHDGNLDAARRYLAWETGLIAQCAPDELGAFRLA